MLDSRRLRVLAAVARDGSLSAAAGALDYTPSAVSQQMAALEREVGAQLVERTARGVVLTEAGRALARHAERILAGLEAAEAEVQALAGLRAGVLRLGWFATAGASLMPRAIAAFRARHPQIELRLIEADPDECIQRLRARELELALVYQFDRFDRPPPADVPHTELVEDRVHVSLPRDHALARRAVLHLRDLAGEQWIQGVRRGSTLGVLPTACREAGFEPDIAFQTDDPSAVHGLIAAGVGVGVIPTIALPTARRDIAVRPVERPLLLRRIRAATPPGGDRSPAAAAMLDVLHEVAPALIAEASRYLAADAGTRSP
jgi:DNA-binding transcriptional LysR family regulator